VLKQNSEPVFIEGLWQDFVQKEQLTPAQEQQFRQYTDMLLEWNEKTNITRITALADVLEYHYRDALHLDRFIDISTIKTICDIGTGGGIPGIPLKIKYPHLRVLLIEVNTKKIAFLREVIESLGLENIEIIDLDWRTFLRSIHEPIDLFVARASLSVSELVRALTSGTSYHRSTMIYWASMRWFPLEQEKKYIQRDEAYEIGDKMRRYIFLRSE
jgi:16S rRNA (guanine527-N7)-methyltransferase